LRYRADIEYDGTEFFGWQRQAGPRTVQGALEAALQSVTGRPAAVIGAGRTDVGVHATGQVAHFDSDWRRPTEDLVRAVNAVLPPDVALRGLAEAAAGFHARYDAIGRSYRYRLLVAARRSPLARRTSFHLGPPLAVPEMADAAARFVGVHDFVAFGQALTAGGPTVRRIERCTVRADGRDIWIEVDGNAFLRHQVRRMVGALIDVGQGRMPPDAIGRALAGEIDAIRPRRVPAQGLTLVAVRYPV
jgi:tRNA pseudouridine38-40 synthase